MMFAAAAAMTVGAGYAAADGSAVAAGPYDVVEVDSGAGSVVQTGAVRLLKGGEIHKIGAGDWSVPSGALDADGGTIGVRQGSLTLTDGGAPAATPPTAILNRAVLWLDATSANVVTTNGENGVAYVTAWRDVRETKSAPPYDHPRMVPRYLASVESWAKNAPPEIRQDAHENRVVYFGRYRSGRWMALVGASDADDAAPRSLNGIRHAFLVFRAVDNFWFPLSMSSGSGQCWHPETSAAAFGTSVAAVNYPDDLTLPGKIHYVDGRQIDPVNTKLRAGQFLFEHQYLYKPGFLDSLANCASITGTGTGNSRQGGDDYCEIILFEETLTEVERRAVEDYLMAKWSLAPTSGRPEIDTAAGTTVNLSCARAPMVAGRGSCVKTGAGDTLMPTWGDDAPQTVPVTIDAGRVIVGDEIPVAPVAGKVYDSERTPDGGRVAVGDDAAGTIRKTGVDRLRFESLPAGLARLEVAAGELTLAARSVAPSASTLVPAPAAEGTITAPGFEGGGGTSWAKGKTPSSRLGWTYYSDATYANPPDYFAGIYDSAEGLWGSLTAHSGTAFGVMRGQSYIYTDVEIPVDGFYELTFWLAQRNGNMSNLDVRFGKANALQTVARVFNTVAVTWRQVRISLPYAKAGTNRLYFHSINASNQSCPLVDDIRITPCARAEAIVKIPYGDFEVAKSRGYASAPSDADWSSPQAADAPEGWTITPAGDSLFCTLAKIGVTNAVGRLGSLPIGNQGGTWQLVLAGTSKTLATTFTPAEFGRFRLRAELGKYRSNSYASGSYVGEPNIQVTVAVDGVETSLGKLTPEDGACGAMMKRAYCPTALVIPSEARSVTVTIRNGASDAMAMLDNLVLERSETDVELLKDGGFESDGDWTYVDGPDVRADRAYGDWAGPLSYGSSPYNYGYAQYAGNRRLRLWNSCAAVQAVTFPEAGDYQLRFHAAMRVDSRPELTTYQKGLEQFSAWLVVDGVTNVLGKSISTTSNYVAHCWRFHVPRAGTYDFAFAGARYANEIGKPSIDHTAYIDGASIRKVETEDGREAAPEMPETLKMVVADGAQLRLDFAGTNKVHSVRIAGAARAGVIDAASCPGVVFGTGALYVVPKGMFLMVR